MNPHTRIALGTVKLGLSDYGFSPTKSQPNFDSLSFLRSVANLGISKFDTSPRYGNAETHLGHYIQQTSSPPFVSTKIDELRTDDKNIYIKMRDSVLRSLRLLHLSTIDLCYLHQNESHIISNPNILTSLQKLKQDGLIKATGASLYSYEECELAIESGAFDFIQIPVNICDTGFHKNFVAKHQSKTRFVARSVFLQGTILNPSKIQESIQQANEMHIYFQRIQDLLKHHPFTIQEIALAFVLNLSNIDHAIIGTTNIDHLTGHIESAHRVIPSSLLEEIYDIASQDKQWSNPRNW